MDPILSEDDKSIFSCAGNGELGSWRWVISPERNGPFASPLPSPHEIRLKPSDLHSAIARRCFLAVGSARGATKLPPQLSLDSGWQLQDAWESLRHRRGTEPGGRAHAGLACGNRARHRSDQPRERRRLSRAALRREQPPGQDSRFALPHALVVPHDVHRTRRLTRAGKSGSISQGSITRPRFG